MNVPARSDGKRWIVDARFDLWIVLLPLAASILSLFLIGTDGRAIPLWAFLLVVVAFDVAHVWATIYVTYLDREVLARRRWLLLSTPVIGFLVAYRIHQHSATLFWSLLAYVAIFHFIKQQWGFIAMYKARAGERSSFDYYLDKWTLWAGALGPVMLWHASPARQFDWFNAGESFIVQIDPALKPDILWVTCGLGGLYLIRQLQLASSSRGINWGKNLWMGCSWVSWWVGIGYSDHPIISAAFLNLLHGIPFLALIWYRSNRRWALQVDAASSWVAWISQRHRWPLFYLVILVAAVLEESLWDGLVWRVYLPELTSLTLPVLSAPQVSFWVALLSVPQITHYYLDAWIWKMDGSNPDLAQVFDLGRRSAGG